MRLKRAGIITKIVVFALAVFALVTLINLSAKIDEAENAHDTVQDAVQYKAVTNAEVQYKIQHKDDDEVIAEIAGDELNLAEPGARVFYHSAD